MKIQNASATPCTSYQLQNVNTVRLESRDVTTQPGEVDDMKSEVIAFVVQAGMDVTAKKYLNPGKKFLCLKNFALFNRSSV